MDEPWEYRELTDKEIDSCIEFSAEFYNKNDNADDPSAVVEQYAIDLFLRIWIGSDLKALCFTEMIK